MIEESGRRKKLKYILITVILITIIGTFSTYTYFTNSLNSALKKSLETFNLTSVSSSPITEGVELNITFKLRNPTDFPVVVETITISFEIDYRDIGGINIAPNKTVSANEDSYFHFIRRVKDETVLSSLQNDTYKLIVTEGSWITGSSWFFLFHAHAKKSITYSEIIHNT